uniref:Uncharacterized protein n=1 Tax=Cacopsylla melanoneura TaxID=428564 RepID=A0A8D8T0M5_9HEMI
MFSQKMMLFFFVPCRYLPKNILYLGNIHGTKKRTSFSDWKLRSRDNLFYIIFRFELPFPRYQCLKTLKNTWNRMIPYDQSNLGDVTGLRSRDLILRNTPPWC